MISRFKRIGTLWLINFYKDLLYQGKIKVRGAAHKRMNELALRDRGEERSKS